MISPRSSKLLKLRDLSPLLSTPTDLVIVHASRGSLISGAQLASAPPGVLEVGCQRITSELASSRDRIPNGGSAFASNQIGTAVTYRLQHDVKCAEITRAESIINIART